MNTNDLITLEQALIRCNLSDPFLNDVMNDFVEADILPWPAMLHKFEESEKTQLFSETLVEFLNGDYAENLIRPLSKPEITIVSNQISAVYLINTIFNLKDAEYIEDLYLSKKDFDEIIENSKNIKTPQEAYDAAERYVNRVFDVNKQDLTNDTDYLGMIYGELDKWNKEHPEANMRKYQAVSSFVKTLPKGILLDIELPEFKDKKQGPLIHQGNGIFICDVNGREKTVTVPHILPFIENLNQGNSTENSEELSLEQVLFEKKNELIDQYPFSEYDQIVEFNSFVKSLNPDLFKDSLLDLKLPDSKEYKQTPLKLEDGGTFSCLINGQKNIFQASRIFNFLNKDYIDMNRTTDEITNYAYDIQWDIPLDEALDHLDEISNAKAAEALDISEERYAAMNTSERHDYAMDVWHHSPASLEEFMGLPDKVEIPTDLTDEEDISDWLSEEYGFCHNGFKLTSDEQKDVKEESVKKGRGR